MRLTLVLALLIAVLGAPVAEAGARRAADVPTDRAFSGPGWKFRDVENFTLQYQEQQRRIRQQGNGSVLVVPQVVVVAPGRCWQAGYWDYQWVPQSYSYTAWVPGQWTPDGSWIEGHYQPAWYSGGYYQPFWVEGYWTTC